MRTNAYSIFDTKGLTYSNPFYAPTHGAALRIVKDAANDANSSLGRHPADYVLYCVGSYDDSIGLFMPLEPKEHVIDVVALINDTPADLFSNNQVR